MNIAKLNQICMNCFSERALGVSVCPICGYDEAAQGESIYHIPPRTILSGKYLIGKVLGEGGFGITYLGYDLNLDLKVAVKEYYPTGLVMRSTTVSMTVQPAGGEQGEFFRKGRERFVDEAKRLARFRTLPGIVRVNDFFVENGTAYIVMEFVEGITLKSYMAQTGGKLPAAQVFDMLAPVFSSLAEVHQSGIIHRDISPDNIMITSDGGMKLLDFGAAREFGIDEKSLSVMLKHGYAPVEQYQSRGMQGPHTDVYALSATIYKTITGVTPENAMDRVFEDVLQPPSALGVALSPQQEAALMKGLAVRAEDRWQTVGELQEALGIAGAFRETPKPAPPPPPTAPHPVGTTAPGRPPPSPPPAGAASGAPTTDAASGAPTPPPTKKPASKKSKTPKIIAAAIAACVVVVAIVLALTLQGTLGGNSGEDTPTGGISSNGDNTPFAETPEATPTVPPDAETPEATPTPRPDTTPSLIDDRDRDYEVIEFGGYVWRVLDVQDGKALIISEDILEIRYYHDISGVEAFMDSDGSYRLTYSDGWAEYSVTWATSDMRAYLNGEFYNSFSASDKAMIADTNVINNDNPWMFSEFGRRNNTPGGADTTDKIFLLSIDEVIRYFGDSGMLARGVDENARDENLEWPNHGIYWWGIHDEYSENRIAYHPGGTYIELWGEEMIEEGAAWGWWLRSPGGISPRYATTVHGIGSIHLSGSFFGSGVRPAMWLILE